MKQIKEDSLIAEIYLGDDKPQKDASAYDAVATNTMRRVISDLEKLARTLDNPNTPDTTKSSIENFFYQLKEYPI